MAANFDLQVLLSLVDNLTGPIQTPMRALQAVERQAQRVETGVAQMANGAGLVAAGASIAAPLAFATNEAIQFESAMADVKKVVDFETPAALAEMEDDLMDLSDRIPIAAEGFAQIAAAAGQAGIQREEIVQFSEDAAKMGVAFDMGADQAGGAMTGLRTIFKLTQDGVVSLGDSVNYLSNNMDAKASNIVDILNRTGGTGKLIGMTGQEVAALGATFLALKKPPEVAATGINALLLKLSTAEQQAKPFQEGLESIGLTARQIKKWMTEDAQGGILRFLDTVRGSDDVIGTLGQLFGAEYADDIAALVGNMDTYRKALGLSGDATAYAGSMNREYAARADTTENALKLLKNNAQNFGIVMGDIVAPSVRDVAEWLGTSTRTLRTWAQEHPEATRRVVALVSGLAGLLFVLGVLVTTVGLVNVAVGQAIGGWGLLRAGWAGAQATATGLTARLVQLGAAARAANLSQQLALQQNATGMARFSLATSGAGVALRGAATAAGAWAAAMAANPVTWVVLAVVALGAAFVYAWRQSERFRATVVEAFVPVQQAWVQLQASLSSLGMALGPVGAAVSGFFARFQRPLDALGYAIGWILGFVLTGLVLLAAHLARSFVDMFSGLVDIVTGAINLIVGLVTGDTDKMRLGVTQILAGLERVWSAIFGVRLVQIVQAFGVKLYTSVTSWISSLGQRLAQIGTVVATAVNTARNWLTNTAAAWREAGANLIDGLVGGIRSKLGEAINIARQLASVVRGAFTGDMDIHSPSRVFHAYGGYIVDGLAQGLDATAGRAVQASQRLAAGVALAGMTAAPTVGLNAPASAVSPTTQTATAPGAAASSRPSIHIEHLHLETGDPQGFLAGLQQLIEQHQ